MPTPNPELQAQVQALQESLGLLRQASDITFASSLIQQYWRKGSLSPKQVEWVGKLLAKTRPQPEAPVANAQSIGDLDGILQLFNRAREHLARPAIVLLTDAVEYAEARARGETVEASTANMIRLTVAGMTARYPGTINVTSFDQDSTGRRTFFGRVRLNGVFEPRPGVSEDQVSKMAIVLRLLATDPARIAGEHGRLVGRCCFCRLALEDERSTSRGYGPVCARHYGLPWGDRPAEFAASAR